MKIIGESPEELILAASKDEVARLIGYYYYGDEDSAGKLKTGVEIQVSEMYQRLYDLSQNRDALSAQAKDLRLIASLLEGKEPLIFPKEDS